MDSSLDPGALLGHTYVLSGGLRVRLRLARSSDTLWIRNLLAERSADGEELPPPQLVEFDPRQRVVLCATALIGGSETLIGVGSIALDGDEPAQPDMVIVDGQHGAELAELLTGALVGRAQTLVRGRAA
jgi:hypothetical protein